MQVVMTTCRGSITAATQTTMAESPSHTTLFKACRLFALMAALQADTTLLAGAPTLSLAACCIMRLMLFRPSSSCCWLAARLSCSTHMSRFKSASRLQHSTRRKMRVRCKPPHHPWILLSVVNWYPADTVRIGANRGNNWPSYVTLEQAALLC